MIQSKAVSGNLISNINLPIELLQQLFKLLLLLLFGISYCFRLLCSFAGGQYVQYDKIYRSDATSLHGFMAGYCDNKNSSLSHDTERQIDEKRIPQLKYLI